VSAQLAREVIPHVVYHKGIPAADRAAALQTMVAAAAAAAPAPAAGPDAAPAAAAATPPGPAGGNAVMVSTDAAARGIDLPDITHVVQADFATAAVDFLHRIGRTARAGRAGKVTSLVAPEHATLAEVGGRVGGGRHAAELRCYGMLHGGCR
jgi:hypothetical protein